MLLLQIEASKEKHLLSINKQTKWPSGANSNQPSKVGRRSGCFDRNIITDKSDKSVFYSRMSLSHHQSTFNSLATGATVSHGYYGCYNHYSGDLYGADHLDVAHHQTQSLHPHAAYTSFPAASYGVLTALQGGGVTGAGPSWYDHGAVEPIDSAFCRFDIATGSTAFRRLPVDLKPETVMRMTESGTGRSGGRSACRELTSDAEVSFWRCIMVYFFAGRRLLYYSTPHAVTLLACYSTKRRSRILFMVGSCAHLSAE